MLKGFKFRNFIGLFSSDTMAGKGLTECVCVVVVGFLAFRAQSTEEGHKRMTPWQLAVLK